VGRRQATARIDGRQRRGQQVGRRARAETLEADDVGVDALLDGCARPASWSIGSVLVLAETTPRRSRAYQAART
jgi:hypothetical protein